MFWRLTARELFREFAADQLRTRDQFERDTTHAYQIVRIYLESKGRKRMPTLASLLAPRRGSERQSVDQQRAALAVMAEQYGIPVRRGKVH